MNNGVDGIIYQPVDEVLQVFFSKPQKLFSKVILSYNLKKPYKPGRCETLLKWKPPMHNSIDFKLKTFSKQE